MWKKMSAAIFKRGLTLALTAVLCQFLAFRPVYAQENYPFDLSISPSVVEFAVRPGKSVTQAFELKNNGSVPLKVTPQLRDFQADGLHGLVTILPSLSFPYGKLVNSDIALDQPFTLPAGASQQLVISLTIPENAREQDWYLSLVARTQPDLADTVFSPSSNTTTQGTIVAHMLLRVTQNNQEPLAWKINLELPRFIDSLQRVKFTPTVSNLSRTYAIPDLHVTVLNWQKRIVSEQSGLPERILAQAERKIPAQQTRKDDPRSYEGIPFSLNEKFALGPYTVRASIANSTGGPTIVEQEVFAFPFSILAAILVLVVLIWFLRIFQGKM